MGDELTRIEQEQLAQIWMERSVWAGDLISKTSAYNLADMGLLYCDKDGRWSIARGVNVVISFELTG